MEKKDEERAIEMTGGTAANLAEALDQWENEREIIDQLHDENQAYTIAFRRFDLAITMAGKIISQVEQDAGLFITEKTRNEIQQFRDQVARLQPTPAKVAGATRTIVQDMKETSTERKKPHAKQTHTNPPENVKGPFANAVADCVTDGIRFAKQAGRCNGEPDTEHNQRGQRDKPAGKFLHNRWFISRFQFRSLYGVIG